MVATKNGKEKDTIFGCVASKQAAVVPVPDPKVNKSQELKQKTTP